MESTAALIRALASLAWPVLAFYVLRTFEPQLRDVLSRLKRGKIGGAELELSERLDNLVASASEAASEATQLPDDTSISDTHADANSEAERRIIDELSRSPKAALMLLTSEIDRAVRLLLAVHGITKRTLPLPRAIADLEARGLLPRSVVEALGRFSDVRNRIVHGQHASDNDIIRAIDAGLLILRTVQSSPQPVAIVRNTGIPVYADRACTVLRPEVTAVVIDEISSGGVATDSRMLPTRQSLIIGRRIGWKFSYERDYPETWYKDPETGECKHAWAYAKEFIGCHLEDM